MRIFIRSLVILASAHAWLWAQTPVVTNQPANLTVWSGTTATFKIGVSGNKPLTYQWLFNNANLPTSIISTVAGGGIGDGNPATNAILSEPEAVAIDAAGNVYIADEGNNRIRRVSTNGVITTVAGDGMNLTPVGAARPEGDPVSHAENVPSNFSGDGGQATNATLFRPADVVLDADGDLLIADAGNNRVRKVDANGIITTIVGNGTATYAGDGGAATNASLSDPTGLALDAEGDLFIADSGNCVVRKVNPAGEISTVAGSGTYGFSGDGGQATNALLGGPYGVAVDVHGNLFVSDQGNQRIRLVNTQGLITTYAGTNTYGFFGDGGPATNAALWNPAGLALDAAGNLYVADVSNDRIRRIATSGIITTMTGTNVSGFFGDGLAATNAALSGPYGVRFDSEGDFYIADTYNGRIRKVGVNDLIGTVAGDGTASFLGDGGPAGAAAFSEISALAFDNAGNLYVADTGNSRIRRVGTNGIVTTYAGNGASDYSGDLAAATNASFYYPVGVAVDAAGDVFVADELNNRIRKITASGIISTVAGTNTAGFGGDGGPAANALLNGPSGVALDSAGDLYVADRGNERIRMMNTKGFITTVAGNGAAGPYLIGTYSGDGGAATAAGLSYPSAVTLDAAGNLYISDAFNYRIRVVGTNGIINTFAGNGSRAFAGDGGRATNASIGLVFGMSVDTSSNLLFADNTFNRIREVSPSGIINTIAGDGTAAFAGDGGAATNASLGAPSDIVPDQSGNWYIADTGNARIRKVTNLTPGPTLTLSDVTADQAGDYQFVVTNSSGSVTSSIAVLTVASVPFIYQTAHNANDSLTLDFVSEPASTNVLLTATNLSPSAIWLPFATNVANANGDGQFSYTNTTRLPERFYRFSTVPTP